MPSDLPATGAPSPGPPDHPDRARSRRRRRLGLCGVILLFLACFLVSLPVIRVVVEELHDALSPLPNRPAPYRQLPASRFVVPTGDIAFDSDATGNYEIYLLNPGDGKIRQLTDDRQFDSWWAQISPDRRHILFYRSPRGVHDTDPSRNSLWVMDANGSQAIDLRPVGTNGWRIQGHAEWSPTGVRLVMAGGSAFNSQIYVTTATGQDPVAVTHRGGTNIDPNWEPDGRGVVFVGCPHSICFSADYEVYALALDSSSPPVQLTEGSFPNYDPAVSPDGKQVAWLRETVGGSPGQWNIMIANLNGTGIRDLTDDSDVNSKPSWSPNGKLIYFHRLVTGATKAFGIWAISPDGSDLRPVLPARGSVGYEYPDT